MQQLLMEREKNWSNLRSKLEETMLSKDKLYNEHLDLIQEFNQYKIESQNTEKEITDDEIIDFEILKSENVKLIEEIDFYKKVSISKIVQQLSLV